MINTFTTNGKNFYDDETEERTYEDYNTLMAHYGGDNNSTEY